MAVDATGLARWQLIQGALAAKGATIARGELVMTALDPLGLDLSIDPEATMAATLPLMIRLAVCFACLRQLGRGTMGGLVGVAIQTLSRLPMV